MAPRHPRSASGTRGGPVVEAHRWNALYLVAAVAMIFMTLAIAIQPLFLRKVLGVSLGSAGMINANVDVVAELSTLVVIGGMGFLSDRFGRVPILVGGFLVGAFGAALAPFSAALGALLGVGGLAVYYIARVVMAFGTCAVWPQLATLAGDFTDTESRARRMSNATSMMAFGSTLVFAVLMQIPRHTGIVPVMLFDALIGAAGSWLAYRLLADVAPPRLERAVPWRAVKDLVLREPRLRVAFAAALFSRGNVALIGLFYMLWTIYFGDLIGRSEEQAAAHAGLVIGVVGLVLVVTSLAWGRVVDALGRLNAITVGMAVSGVGFVLMALVVNPFDSVVLVPMILIALGQAGVLLAPDVLAFDCTPRDLRGSMMGALNVVGGIGLIVLLEVGGALFDIIGPYAPFTVLGVGNLVVMVYARRVAMGEPGKWPKDVQPCGGLDDDG